jgi:ribosomal protein L16 Arg81 hydroxylase
MNVPQPEFPLIPEHPDESPQHVNTGDAQKKQVSGAEIALGFSETILTEEFWEKHWERWPLHHRASSSGPIAANLLPGVLTADDISDIVHRSGYRYKLVRKGESVSENNFVVAYLEGASVIVNQAERYHPTLFQMCRVLASRHFHHTFGVVYLTPPNSSAVRLHNDDQDVFLMQVWGTKHWTIRDAPQLLPYTEEMLGKEEPVPPDKTTEKIMTFDLEPGDVLYIPRGFLHEAATSSTPSLHITMTVPTCDYCWGVQTVKHLMNHLYSRETPPETRKFCSEATLGNSNGLDEASLGKHVEDILKRLETGLSLDTLLDGFEQRMSKPNDAQERSHLQAMSAKLPTKVREDHRVRLMPGVTCSCEENSELAVFHRGHQHMQWPIARSASALVRSLSSAPQLIRNLPCADTFERLSVIELLYQTGVLQLFTRGADERTLE